MISNFRNNFKSIILNKVLIIFSLIGIIFFCSCSDNAEINQPIEHQGLIIKIPYAGLTSGLSGFTRDGIADHTSQEANINNIYLIALYKENNGDNNYKTFDIVELLDPVISSDGSYIYMNYHKPLDTGYYKFYVVANLDRYLTSGTVIDNVKSENDLLNLNLYFSAEKPLQGDNLPMACFNPDIAGTTQNNNYVYIKGGDPVTITALMRFLCAKVRYTILFDNNSISSAFGKAKIDFYTSGEDGPTVTNVMSQTPLSSATSNYNNLFTVDLPFDRFLYPDDNPGYPASFSDELVPFEGNDEGWDNHDSRAWQGVIYLPENLTTERYNTVLNFPYKYSGSMERIGEKTMAFTSNPKLERSQMYDLIAKVTSPDYASMDISVSVSDWTLETATYSLKDNKFELVVEKTALQVGTKDWETLGYYSDTDVSFESPLLDDGTPVFIIEEITSGSVDADGNYYTFNDNWSNHLRLRVNSEIPFAIYSDIKKDVDKYNFFYIAANNLYKKIDIDPLLLDGYLEVSPKNIEISVKDFLAATKDGGTLTISYNTNVPNSQAKISLSEENGLLNLDSSDAIYLSKENLNSSNELTSETGELKLNMSGFLSGNVFWNSEHIYELKFKLDVPEAGTIVETVTIKINPYYSDYIIHFKPAEAWELPHIYVYQYLQLPVNLMGTNADYAGRFVGYKLDDGNYYPAIEYAFSNNLSFVGWQDFGGTADPHIANSKFEEGLLHLGGVDSDESRSYNYSETPAEGHSVKYNYTYNLNLKHYASSESWECEECKSLENLNMNGTRGWPGIVMEKEDDGWWKYTLTSLATPGKTMIKFADGHDGVTDLIYPQVNDPGIPLFDYPDKEGWFFYNPSDEVHGFIDDKP